jgi:hypothetical protein
VAQIRYHLPAEEVPEGPVPEHASWGGVALGGLGQDVSGNRRRFQQYATPPSSGYPSLIRIEGISRGGGVMSLLDIRDISEPARAAHFAVRNMKSLVEFEGNYRHDDFFESFSSGAGNMERDDFEATLKVPVSRDLDLHVGTGYLALDGPSDAGPVDWRALDVGTRAYWSNSSLAIDGQFVAEDFRQLGGTEVGGMDRVASLAVRLSPSDRHTLEAEALLQNTQLDGFGADLERALVAVSLNSELRPHLLFRGSFLTQEIDETITQNSYEAGREQARAVLLYGGVSKTLVEAGMQHSETEYVDRYHRSVERPETTTFWTKVRYRPWKPVKVSGAFVRRDAADLPPRPSDFGQLQGPIVTFDEHERANVNVTYDMSDQFGLSGGVRNDEWAMSPEGVAASLETTSINAWLVPSDSLTLTGSFLSLDWGIDGVDGAGLGERDYVSKVNAYSAGAVLQLDARSAASATFSHSNGFGAVETRENTLSVWWHRQIADDTEVRLTFTDQDFEEGIAGGPNDFDATLIGGQIARRF